MNNKKLTLIITLFLLNIVLSFGQEYRIQPVMARIVKISEVPAKIIIKGTTKNQLSIRVLNLEKAPEKSMNLVPIGKYPETSSTGLNIQEDGNVINIRGVRRAIKDAEVLIEVPNTLNLILNYTCLTCNSDVMIDQFMGGMDIETIHRNIIINNPHGPLSVYSQSGDITVNLKKVPIENPLYLVSASGNIELDIPENSTASLSWNVGTGDIHMSPDLDLVFEDDNRQKISMAQNPVMDKHGSCYLRQPGVKISLETSSGRIIVK